MHNTTVENFVYCKGVPFYVPDYKGAQQCKAVIDNNDLRGNQRQLCLQCRHEFKLLYQRKWWAQNRPVKKRKSDADAHADAKADVVIGVKDVSGKNPDVKKRKVDAAADAKADVVSGVEVQAVQVHPSTKKGYYRLHYPIDTIANTLHKLEANEIASFLEFAKKQRFSTQNRHGDFSGKNPDAYATISGAIHTIIYPKMVAIAMHTCPIFLRPFLQPQVHRMLVNHIVKGTKPHRDGYDDVKRIYITNMLTVVVHVSDGIDHPVRLLIPEFHASIEVPSGYSYVMPGAHLQHETVYEPTEGVNRYSIVCFFKLKGTLNHVSVSDIITEHYK